MFRYFFFSYSFQCPLAATFSLRDGDSEPKQILFHSCLFIFSFAVFVPVWPTPPPPLPQSAGTFDNYFSVPSCKLAESSINQIGRSLGIPAFY